MRTSSICTVCLVRNFLERWFKVALNSTPIAVPDVQPFDDRVFFYNRNDISRWLEPLCVRGGNMTFECKSCQDFNVDNERY